MRVNEMQTTNAEQTRETRRRTERASARSASEEIMNLPGNVRARVCTEAMRGVRVN